MLKKLVPILLALLLLCGCQPKTVQTVRHGDWNFTVDLKENTVSDGTYTYDYQLSGKTLRIVFPDGSWYEESKNGMVTVSDWSDHYDSNPDYADAGDIGQVIWSLQKKQERSPGVYFGAGLLMVMGLICLLRAEWVWHLKYRLWVRDAEPTEFALNWTRISGFVMILLGIILLMFHGNTL